MATWFLAWICKSAVKFIELVDFSANGMTPVETDRINRFCKLHVTGVQTTRRVHLELHASLLILIDIPNGQDQLHSGRPLKRFKQEAG
jgi:hypothetical protein